MRLHRFFVNVPLKSSQSLRLDDFCLVHQWRDVLRYKSGQKINLFDGSGDEYEAIITTLEKRSALVAVGCALQKNKPFRPRVALYQAVIKRDNLELVVQKSTELGVAKIIPILTERSEKKSFNMERLKTIAIEASEQSGRVEIPEICDLMEFEVAISVAEGEKLFFDCGDLAGSKLPIRDNCSIFIGPEGGWTDRERAVAAKAGTKSVSLGGQILRSETAAIVAVAIILYNSNL